jgi:hypothetical protein
MSQLVKYEWITTIANGASLSPPLDLDQGRVAILFMPPQWTPAAITFQIGDDAGTWSDYFNSDGTEYALTVAAGRAIRLPIADFLGIRRLRVRSGTSGTPVNQAAARDIEFRVVA